MGGYGSGRSGGRPTVEDSLSLNLPRLFKTGWLKPGAWISGTLRWSIDGTGEETASIGFEALIIASLISASAFLLIIRLSDKRINRIINDDVLKLKSMVADPLFTPSACKKLRSIFKNKYSLMAGGRSIILLDDIIINELYRRSAGSNVPIR